MLHPLINPKLNKHYNVDGKKTTIEKIENESMIIELIGACKFNIMKYNDRSEHKGSKDNDLEKAEDYQRYLDFLVQFYEKGYATSIAVDAYKSMNIEIEYE